MKILLESEGKSYKIWENPSLLNLFENSIQNEIFRFIF